MLDLSNNNGTGHNFEKAYEAGERRVYFKATEGKSFVDSVTPGLAKQARQAGFKVGWYHFARPDTGNTPAQEAKHFLANIPQPVKGKSLRPCLDIEVGNPDATYGRWCRSFLSLVADEIGGDPIIYSYASFLERMRFRKTPAGLWLANFGPNDGKRHAFSIPNPWSMSEVLAHQYTSRAKVPGIKGYVDRSHVYQKRTIDFAPFDI